MIFSRKRRWSLSCNRSGIWFPYKGDEVCRQWPWTKGKRYISVLFEAEFDSLAAMDREWENFYLANSTVGDIITELE